MEKPVTYNSTERAILAHTAAAHADQLIPQEWRETFDGLVHDLASSREAAADQLVRIAERMRV